MTISSSNRAGWKQQESILSPEPLRIACSVVGLNSSRGGTARSVACLCTALSDLGCEVWLVSENWNRKHDPILPPSSEQVRLCLVKGYCSDRLRLSYAPGLRGALSDLCRKQKIDLIHDHGMWLPFNHCVAETARRLGIPLVVSPRGTLEPWALSHKAWKKKMAWRLFQRNDLEAASLLHATAPQERESFRNSAVCRPVAVVPNGIALPSSPYHRSPGDNGCRRALFLSRLHPKKGLHNLVDAWAMIRPKGWRMIIAGGDEEGHRIEVEESIRKAGIEKDFTFKGHVEGLEKEKLYREADLFVLPTYSENFGTVVAEALSYCIPVITTRAAPWGELVANRCGWWIDVGAAPLAGALDEAMRLSPSVLHEMGRRGRLYTERHLSWPGVASQMLTAYRWVIDGGSPPSFVSLQDRK